MVGRSAPLKLRQANELFYALLRNQGICHLNSRKDVTMIIACRLTTPHTTILIKLNSFGYLPFVVIDTLDEKIMF